ncbi:hypothetical protein, partial [Streptomyces adustus]
MTIPGRSPATGHDTQPRQHRLNPMIKLPPEPPNGRAASFSRLRPVWSCDAEGGERSGGVAGMVAE